MTVTGKRTGQKAMYDVTDLYVSRGFVSGQSVFTPGDSLWTADNFHDLTRLFVDANIGGRDYYEKLQDLLKQASDVQIQLLAELHFLYFLPSQQIRSDRRQQILSDLLSSMVDEVAIPHEIQQGFDVAHIRPGPHYSTRPDLHVGYLIRLGTFWFDEFSTPDDRQAVIEDPWLFKEALSSIPDEGANAQRELLLHLVHPGIFEPITVMADKKAIVERWPDLIGSEDDIDRQLVEVRKHLSGRFGDDFDYYAPGTMEEWKNQSKGNKDAVISDESSKSVRKSIAVYLPGPSIRNFDLVGKDGIWAFKKEPGADSSPRTGDRVIFVFKAKGGPRQPLSQFVEQPVDRVVVATATSDLSRTAETRWPDEPADEVIYPYEFSFVIDETHRHVDARTGPIEDLRVMSAAKSSASIGGLPALIAGEYVAREDSVIVQNELLSISELTSDFSDAAVVAGLDWGVDHDSLTASLLVSLLTKRFVILSGLSGSGKTRLAIALGQWLGSERLRVVPVRPDWTSPDATLGYRDGLESATTGVEKWFVPDVLEFVLGAVNNSTQPFVLVLDEMNLAHVERYFAEMLSGIESGQNVVPNLVATGSGWERAEGAAAVPWPANLFLIGTVNVDETTYAFSPKVLDRANTIEFRVATESLRSAGAILPVERAHEGVASSFLAHSGAATMEDGSEDFQASLKMLHALLSRHGFEFGHRVFQEAIRFRGFAKESLAIADDATILDLQLMQKVLPRVHGAQRRVQTVLEELLAFSSGGAGSELPRSRVKLTRMVELVRANHFVAFTD